MRFKDKVAIITGAARGIGRAIAEKLASEGAKVVIADLVSEEEGNQVASEIASKHSTEALYIRTNVTVSGDVEKLFKETVEKFGKVDILVNNAGITRDTLILRMKEEDWDAVINVNLKGVFLCTKEAVKYMMKARYGRIINISSVVGLMGNAGQANYSASKAGVIGLTKSVAKEVASRGVTVNAVAPGFIKTAMTDKLPEEIKKSYIDATPIKRMGEPEDVANAVAFLASDEASFITGEVIRVDGGLAM